MQHSTHHRHRVLFGLLAALLATWLAACASPSTASQHEFSTEDCASNTGLRPDLVDLDEEHYCPPGHWYDRSFHICENPHKQALGPFTTEMVERCVRCGGNGCDGTVWPANQARRMRGAGDCPRGSELQQDGLCSDEAHAYGPFSRAMVSLCERVFSDDALCHSMRFPRALAEQLVDTLGGGPQPGSDVWSYPLPVDHGLRMDSHGRGDFGATRANNPGGHSGIDLLAPKGMELLAVCDGEVRYAGPVTGYGNFVALICPVPLEVASLDEPAWASIAYAHLDEISVQTGQMVSKGAWLGTVGNSGNASGSGLNFHVHFEIALHADRSDAATESHASSDHHGNAAADAVVEALTAACLAPHGFEPTTGPVSKGRRIDPFLMLTCLSHKPALTAPPSSLQSAIEPWSEHYLADDFDVDEGL